MLKMSVTHLLLILVCVISIALGQLVFKKAGMEWESAGTWINFHVIVAIGLALLIYGFATVLWVYILRVVPLNQAYPFVALSFIIVPVASSLVYKEALAYSHIIGFLLIVSGIVAISRSGS